MSRIIDNEEIELVNSLKENLPHSDRLDACVGYFNLRGWQSIRDAALMMNENQNLEAPKVRLLVGMALSGEEQTKLGYDILHSPNDDAMHIPKAVQLSKSMLRAFAIQLTWGLPTDADQQSLLDLLADLKSGFLKVSFYARHPLHAKLYLAHLAGPAENYRAVVGSSNFTPSGLFRNGELNIEESDVQHGRRLSKWFNERWDDPFSIDITEDLIEVLENCWAIADQPSPRLVHLKMAYELSRDARAGKSLQIPADIAQELLPWQEAAVQISTRMLMHRGLVVIGDVVGLGKTLVGTAIAATVGERVLIICPKNLVKMWDEHLQNFSIPGKVISLSTVERDLADLRRYKLVLIDESHNLRHTTRKDYKAIRQYITENDPQVVLMTATMYNADHLDISGQLGLKLETDEDLGIRPEKLLEELGPQGELELAEKTGGKLSTLAAFNFSTSTADWQRLLSQFLVRRTRSYIKQTYGKVDSQTGKVYFEFRDGTRFHFPDRTPEPLEYAGGPKDPGDLLASIENFDALAAMKFARYQPGRYLVEPVTAIDSDEETLLSDMRRANSTNGFIRTTVLKRLASSPKAFFITVEKMLLRAHVLKYALDNYLDIPIGTLDDRAYVFSDDDQDIDDADGGGIDPANDNQEASWAIGLTELDWERKAKAAYDGLKSSKPRGLRWARHEMFDAKLFAKHVAKDNSVLQTIVDAHGDWSVENDSKLKSLADLVNNLDGQKLLVFSEYKDTIDYVHRYLVPLCPGIKIEAVSGSTTDPTIFAKRFSPVSNAKLGGLPAGSTEIQVLLATDVLSEGQNLQDASIVLNWDLPWTIIKIIQRAGRVDRVGQKAEKVRVLSFMPHEGVNDRIRLIQRLAGRLEVSREILGMDDNFFDFDFEKNDEQIAGMFSGTANLDLGEGEVDFGSYALGIWDGASEAERVAARHLPIGVVTSKSAGVAQLGRLMVVHSKVISREEAPVDLIVARVATAERFRTLTQMEALKLTASDPGEEPARKSSSQTALIQDIVTNAIAPQSKTTRIVLNHGLKRNVYELLMGVRDELPPEHALRDALETLADKLHSFTFFDDVKTQVAELYRTRRRTNNLDVARKLIELYETGLMLDESDSALEEIQIVSSMEFVEKNE